MEFASAHVASSVFSKLKGMDDEALQDMISACKAYPKAASLRGSMFELLAHSIISCRGKFSVRDAKMGAAMETIQLTSAPQRRYQSPSELSSLTKGSYCIPQAGDHPAVDDTTHLGSS